MGLRTLDEILEYLVSSGIPPERVEKLRGYLRKDGLEEPIGRILSLCSSLEDALSEVPDVGGLADVVKEVEYKVRIIREFITNSLLELSKDKGYMRGFFRSKSKAKRLASVLKSAREELDETREGLIEAVKGTLIKSIDSLGLRKGLKDRVRDIRELDDLGELRDVWELVREKLETFEVRDRSSPGKGLTISDDVVQDTLITLDELIGIREELELRGCSFLMLSEILLLRDQLLSWLSSNIGRESQVATNVLSLIKRIAEDSRALLSTSKSLLSLRSELESVKSEVMGKLSVKLPQLTDTLSMVGISSPRLPCTVTTSQELSGLRYEVSKLKELVSLLKDLSSELDHPLEDLQINPEKLSYRTETEFLRSLVEAIRSLRLSRGLPSTAYSLPGLMAELLSLYPKWREHVRSALTERGSMDVEELSFIPQSWREWFLHNLEEEGLIRIEGNRIVARTRSREVGKLRMKLDFLKDTYEEMGPLFRRAGVDEGYIADLERKMELLEDAKGDERRALIREVEERIERALSVLRGALNEEDEAGGRGSSPGWQVDLNP
ncbi:MAG: hypothetical protein QI197_06040 [Candidatus Korarchaeota archaeon]|nr:hypothetical protein [Candidatus Korarchaeota archaeon]